MTKKQIEACWNDPRNRRWGVYFCKQDPRPIVPRHRKWMGWTANFAQPAAVPWLLFLISIMLAPMRFLSLHGAGTSVTLLAFGGSLAIVCLFCAYLSSRTS